MRKSFVALAVVCFVSAACAEGGGGDAGQPARRERAAGLEASDYETAVSHLRQAEQTLPRLAREIEVEHDWSEAINSAADLEYSLYVVWASLYLLEFPGAQPPPSPVCSQALP